VPLKQEGKAEESGRVAQVLVVYMTVLNSTCDQCEVEGDSNDISHDYIGPIHKHLATLHDVYT